MNNTVFSVTIIFPFTEGVIRVIVNKFETFMIADDSEIVPIEYFSFATHNQNHVEFYYNCSSWKNIKSFTDGIMNDSLNNLFPIAKHDQVYNGNKENEYITNFNWILLAINFIIFFILVLFFICVHFQSKDVRWVYGCGSLEN